MWRLTFCKAQAEDNRQLMVNYAHFYKVEVGTFAKTILLHFYNNTEKLLTVDENGNGNYCSQLRNDKGSAAISSLFNDFHKIKSNIEIQTKSKSQRKLQCKKYVLFSCQRQKKKVTN